MIRFFNLKFLLVLPVCLFCLGFNSISSAVATDKPLQSHIFEIIEKYESAIVRVKAAFRKEGTEGKPSKLSLRVGTGFFITQEGHILVNASRALGSNRIGVEYKGNHYPAEAIGHDPLTNISLLRLLEKPKTFGVVPVPQEHMDFPLGSFVVSLSCPLDFSVSPNIGIISGIDKKLGDQIFPTAYLRTSISAGSGQGGCPVFDRHGQLIGMTIASIPELNGSYVLPTNSLARVKEDLMAEGRSLRGWIGIEVTENISHKDAHNVRISELTKLGPAEKSGLRVGDKIISIGEMPICHITDLPSAIFKTYVNQFTPIVVQRDENIIEFLLQATEQPKIEIKKD